MGATPDGQREQSSVLTKGAVQQHGRVRQGVMMSCETLYISTTTLYIIHFGTHYQVDDGIGDMLFSRQWLNFHIVS